MKISEHPQCHVWNNPALTWDDLKGLFETEKVYSESSHFERYLLRCPECGQLYFYEFYEVVDWDDGDDKMYSTWIAVDDVETADGLARLSSLALMQYPTLRNDYPGSNAGREGFYHHRGLSS
jgi:hypothetical protein